MEPDIGGGRSINAGPKNAHKEARRLIYTGAGSPTRGTIHRISGVESSTLETELASNDSAADAAGPLYMQLTKVVASGLTPGFKAGKFEGLLHGVITEVDTSGSSVKAPVYLGVDGAWTLTKPTSAAVRVVGEVLVVSATIGEILFWGHPQLAQPAHLSPVVAVTKTANGVSSVAFSAADLGGTYTNAPASALFLGAAAVNVLRAAWSAGTLTVTLSGNGGASDRVAVIVAPTGDAL